MWLSADPAGFRAEEPWFQPTPLPYWDAQGPAVSLTCALTVYTIQSPLQAHQRCRSKCPVRVLPSRATPPQTLKRGKDYVRRLRRRLTTLVRSLAAGGVASRTRS
jgi:hypothetical protein